MRFLLLVVFAMACSTGEPSESCLTNANCDSNNCVNGMCAPAVPDAGVDASGGNDAAPDAAEDAASDAGDDVGNDAGNDAGPPTINVAIEATNLLVRVDCDGGGEGDFFISVRLRNTTEAEELLGENLENLVQAPGGSTRPLAIRASGTVPAVTGTRVVANVSFYENDASGPQVSAGMGFTYIYDATEACWRLDGAAEGDCLQTTGGESTGEIDRQVIRLRDTAGDECNADLIANFFADPPSE